MFWKLPTLSASSPVEAILDKENFTLEELLDEEEVIQECKALNSRLINFLRDRAQVEQLLHYIIEEPAEDADSKCTFKFPFIACEVFTCEIDVILKTLVEEEELMDLLFSFLNPDRPHSALLAGYFSKVVVCLMLRKTALLMNYVQAHQDILQQLVDLIGITSIMEVLVRLVGADDHVYPNFLDVMQWLADSNLLEMIVDKLSPSAPPEVHCNASETLCAITRNAPSALATKLSSASFVERVFGHALEESCSKSGIVNSLSVCISLLDPRRTTASSSLFHSYRSQHMYECPVPVNPETINAMLSRLGDLLLLLNVSSDENILPTTYGELRPPLGKHRLKVVEFIAVLMKSGSEDAEKELISSGTILRILDLFFEYPYNNALHHHVESIIISCLESRSDLLAEHLFRDCSLIEKMLRTDRSPKLSNEFDQPTLPSVGKFKPRAGNIGHITRISKKINQLGSINSLIQRFLQENSEWSEWQATVLQERIAVENVLRWACGRPTALLDRAKDSDEEDIHDRDYDVAALANSLSQAFSYNIYENEDAEEDRRPLDGDDEDVYFDDESAEVVISSLRLGDDQGSLFTNSNWFAFQDDRMKSSSLDTLSSEMMDDINPNGGVAAGGGNNSSDDEVVVGEDMEEIGNKSTSNNNTSTSNSVSEEIPNSMGGSEAAKSGTPFEIPENEGDMPLPEWVGWGESLDALQIGGSSVNPFIDDPDMGDGESPLPSVTTGDFVPDGSADLSQRSTNSVPSLFEEDLEFIGVEAEGTEKAMEHALKEGIVGEAGPLKRNLVPMLLDNENTSEADAGGVQEFNDTNYWKLDQEVPVHE